MSKYGGFSGPYAGKYGPEKIPYMDTFHAVHSALAPNHIEVCREPNNHSPDNFIDGEINLRKNGETSRHLQICFGDDGCKNTFLA